MMIVSRSPASSPAASATKRKSRPGQAEALELRQKVQALEYQLEQMRRRP